MADVICTITIMPESPEVNIEELKEKVNEKIADFAGEGENKVEITPVAFGLKSLNITFVMDESKGSTEPLEKSCSELENVASAEITDVRRAMG